ncbi:MAG: phosphopyruvate hydratase [Candidatus Stahlbacteria bacterium]|nr:MAG: phosphopyruvate hydratase [Candidatus Stahlbacteria bacterium]
MDTKIKTTVAREILDSRGNPTVEVEIELNSGLKASAAVPSGASTGIHEALELRDKDAKRYGGKGVLKAVHNVNKMIAPELIGKDVIEQENLDQFMIKLDSTPNKMKFGANAILGISMAIARAAALAQAIPLYKSLGGSEAVLLPVPMMNVLNGGVHANWQGPDFQEYMIAPYGANNFREAMRWGSETYQTLKKILKEKGLNTSVGDEGGFVIDVSSNEEPLQLIIAAIEKAGYKPGNDIGIALDTASSSFYENGKYILRTEKSELNSEEMVERFASLVDKYPIVSIEDGLAEDDWDGWKILNSKLGDKIELVGDDIFVTNVERIERGIKENIANAVLIKLNQIGTVTETIAAVKMAQKVKWGAVVSHRSGETVDSFISDFVVAMRTGALKTGAPCRGERVEKYNQLMRIEEELKDSAIYAGRKAFVR